MPSPYHPVLVAQLCKSCTSLKRQLVLKVGRKERRECLGRRQQKRCTASMLEKPRGLEELTEPWPVGEGTWGIDSSGGKGQSVGWETGIWDGGAQRTRRTYNPWLGDPYLTGFSLCNTRVANRARKNTQSAQSHGAGETSQCWVKWRYQLQQRRGMRRQGTEGVPVNE